MNTTLKRLSSVSVLRAAPCGEGCSSVRDHQAPLWGQFPSPLPLQTGFDSETPPHHTLPRQRPMGLSQSYVRKPWVLVLLVFLNWQNAHQVTVAHPQLWPTTSRSSCGAATTRTPTNKTGVSTITSTVTSGVTRSPERGRSKCTTWTPWSLSRTRSRSCRGRRGIRRSWRAASRRRHTDWLLGLEIIFKDEADQLVQRHGETGRRLQTAPKPEASFTATLQDRDQNMSESSPSVVAHQFYQV